MDKLEGLMLAEFDDPSPDVRAAVRHLVPLVRDWITNAAAAGMHVGHQAGSGQLFKEEQG